MSTETWIDKSDWGMGPWQDEPDRIEWRIGDLVGLMLRNPSGGNWCGYVGVPPNHSWHGRGYSCHVDNCPRSTYDADTCEHSLPDIDVHGGVTFSDRCMEDDRPQRERVCHVPQDGESADVWWIGFDCAHAWDVRPAGLVRDRELAKKLRAGGDLDGARLFERGPSPDEHYRTATYVQSEVEDLARQAQLCGEQDS